MGLDVYLQYCPDRPAAKKIEDEFEAFESAQWKGRHYEKMSEDEKKVINDRLAEKRRELGLPPNSHTHPSVRQVEEPSAAYPEHLFKIGYFRSSYNDGGINRILGNLGLSSLAEIFEIDPDDYEFHPDWSEVRSRTLETLESYNKATSHGLVHVLTLSENIFGGSPAKPHSPSEALARFTEEIRKNSAFADSGWTNLLGQFYPKGLKVLGLIPGVTRPFEANLPCTYVIWTAEDGNAAWYRQALEIMVETCDWVLAKPDPQNYYVHWSS